MTTVADLLASQVFKAGVETVFGLPGGENLSVVDAFDKKGIHFQLVSNEVSAVFMADVTSRLTGNLGVCLTTLGPGAANASAGIAHAYLDRAPVLVITAQVPEHFLGYHTHQYVNLQEMFTPITKGSFALQPHQAERTIAEAISLTTSGRPGPVHLFLSGEDAERLVVEKDKWTILGTQTFDGNMESAQELLTQSKHPVIVVGVGLEPEGPYSALRDLAEAGEILLIDTAKSKGCLSSDHPLYVGTIGLTHTDPAYVILEEADCIVAVGFDVVELVKPWDFKAPLIWIAPWENDDPTLPSEIEFIGPMAPILTGLKETQFSPAADWGVLRVGQYRQLQAQTPKTQSQPGLIHPMDVLLSVRENVPDDAIMVTDVGSSKIFTCLSWPTYLPNSFLVSNGISTMGFGLPAAIAASRVHPDRTVICFTGDGGFAMVMGELNWLAGLGNPVMVFVFNDSALDLIRAKQYKAGFDKVGTEFTNPDFKQIAGAYDLDYRRVSNKEECVQAVKTGVKTGKPMLVEVLVDTNFYPTAAKNIKG